VAAPAEIADYMISILERNNYLQQLTIVEEIKNTFGEEFTYINQNGNLAIRKDILLIFKRKTAGKVVWESGEKRWRFRESYDPQNKRRAD